MLRLIKKYQRIFLIALFVLGFLVRLYRFNNPIADWHSWRQADTSAVSRNFVQSGFNLLYPKFDDLSNVPSGLDNPKGYRFVEFPIYNIFQAGLFIVFGHLTLEEWGRIVTIFATLFSSLFLYLLMKKYANPLSAFFTAFFYLFLPYSIYYGRTILPDELMVTATLGGLYFLSLWMDLEKKSVIKNVTFFIITTVFFASALLLKPFAAFFFLPAIWIVWKKYGWKLFFVVQLWLMVVLSVIPLILWRIWMTAFPEGIPASSWLFNGGNIRFTGAFFHWLFAVRIGDLILGFWGLPILVIGIITKKTSKTFFYLFIASVIIYLCVIARGNVQHDYYQIPIIPTIAIFLGLGSEMFIFPPKELSALTTRIVFVICCLFLFAFSWFEIRDYFNINNPSIVIAGQAVDRLTAKNAKVLAPYDGDTSFLYQTKRSGWASFEKPLPDLIQMGANYLVLVNPKPQDLDIGKTYKIVASTKDYVLFDLNEKP